MSFRLFIPDIEEISALLVCSHASSGKSVLLSRHGQVFTNLSAKSTLNEWTPLHRVVQKGLLDVVGDGDGGKLGCFLTISLIRSLALHKHGGHPDLTREIQECLPQVLNAIRARSLPSQKEHLVTLGKELEFADDLAEAVSLSGAETHISLEKYDGVGCEVIESESYHSEARPLHLDEQVTLKGAMVALLPIRASRFSDVSEALELMGTFPSRPLVIIAPMMRGEALATIKRNREEGVVEAYGVEAPLVTWGKGWLEDVASFTGATIYDKDIFPEFKTDFFGSALEITLKQDELIIDPYDDHAELTAQRIEQLLREAETSPHTHTQDLWRKRASMLGGTLVRVKVGGTTEAEARLNRGRAEKALTSMSTMMRGGYVEGAVNTLSEIQGIHPIIDRALLAPLRVVSLNKVTPSLTQTLHENPCLKDPFPTERLTDLVTRSFSVATTLCSVARVIQSKK